MKTVQGIRIFSRKKNPVFKLGSLNNLRTTGFLGQFSQVGYQNQKKLKKKNYIIFLDKIIDLEYIFSSL